MIGTRISPSKPTAPQTFTWGAPGTTATIIATLADGSANACIYGYDTGALLIDGTSPAPARRVHVFLQNDAYAVLTGDGQTLIDAAMSWAMNRPLEAEPPPEITSVTRTGNNITIQWTGGGTLQSTASLSPPITWSNAATGGAFTKAAAGTKFYRVIR